MTIGLLKQGLCDSMVGTFDEGLATMRSAKSQLMGQINTIIAMAGALSLEDPLKDVDDLIPDFSEFSNSDVQEMADMIEACTYLNTHESYKNRKNILRSLQSNLHGLINNIIDLSDPAVLLAQAINTLSQQFGAFGLSSLIPNMDAILNCISEFCNVNSESRIKEMESLMTSLRVDNAGMFSRQSMYAEAGMTEEVFSRVESVINRMDSLKSNISSGLGSLGSLGDLT